MLLIAQIAFSIFAGVRHGVWGKVILAWVISIVAATIGAALGSVFLFLLPDWILLGYLIYLVAQPVGTFDT